MGNQKIVIDCSPKLVKPRWREIIHDSFHELGDEIANLAPIFHVHEMAVRFDLSIEVIGAEFEESIKSELHSTFQGSACNPLDFEFRGNNQLDVKWKGFESATSCPQAGRWILRFLVVNGSGWRQPIHVAFMYVSRDYVANLLGSEASELQGADAVGEEDSRSIKLAMQLEEAAPRFFDWSGENELFNGAMAPEGTHLEPLIVVKKDNHPIDLDFRCLNGKFAPCTRSGCNPVYGNDQCSPVALHWFGATHRSNVECDPEIAAGFRGSRCGSNDDPSSRSEACIHWKEEGSAEIAIASFFFRDLSVDPTIIYDPPKPPGG